MQVNPISHEEAEASSFTPWNPGDYDFVVHEASEEISKGSGSEMIKLTLHIYNTEGRHKIVFDYLLGTDKGQWKVRHFAEAVGLLPQYEAGNLNPVEIVGRPGRAKIRVKAAAGDFPAGNQVADYIRRPTDAASAAPRANIAKPAPKIVAKQVVVDDEIPF